MNIPGPIFLGSFWDLPGIFLGSFWDLPGIFLGSSWDLPGIFLGFSWILYVLGYDWNSWDLHRDFYENCEYAKNSWMFLGGSTPCKNLTPIFCRADKKGSELPSIETHSFYWKLAGWAKTATMPRIPGCFWEGRPWPSYGLVGCYPTGGHWREVCPTSTWFRVWQDSSFSLQRGSDR